MGSQNNCKAGGSSVPTIVYSLRKKMEFVTDPREKDFDVTLKVILQYVRWLE